MNLVEKKYTVKRMEELRAQKEYDINHSEKEFTKPAQYSVPQIMKALKTNKDFEFGDVKDRNYGGYHTDITQLILPTNYTKLLKTYNDNIASEKARIVVSIHKLNKFCSDLSDKVMLGSSEEALNALQQMANYKIY